MVSRAALVVGIAAWPKDSPRPISPSSVSARTSNTSIRSQSCAAKRPCGPPILKGMGSTEDPTAVIGMGREVSRATLSAGP